MYFVETRDLASLQLINPPAQALFIFSKKKTGQSMMIAGYVF